MPRDETRASAHPGFLDTAEPELISSAGASSRRARALVVNLGFQRSTASGTLARFPFAPGRAATATVRQANHGTEIRTGAYSSVLEDALDDMTRYRALVHDLPRRFHQLPHEMQAAARRDPAALTHTGWDALLAPVFEHIARQRDDSIPIRTEEPERVLDPPWVFSAAPDIASATRDGSRPTAAARRNPLSDPAHADAASACSSAGPRPPSTSRACSRPVRSHRLRCLAQCQPLGRDSARHFVMPQLPLA